MSTRTKILDTLAINRPPFIPLPDITTGLLQVSEDPVVCFKDMARRIGIRITEPPYGTDPEECIAAGMGNGKKVIDARMNTAENLKQAGAYELEHVDTVLMQGLVGVAENGAIWLNEPTMQNRLLPFICRHLVIILDPGNIVATMHEAYERISTDDTGFGVFVAGASRTADIEQSLVIGAHGPLSLEVFLVK